MAYLEKFTPEQKKLLIRFPYRAGLWVSRVDDTGGGEAGAEEVATLREIITARAGGMFESAFVHEVFEALFEQKADWERWDDDLDRVPEEAAQIAASLEKNMSARERGAYRDAVMAIALLVARAFREFDVSASFWARFGAWVRLSVDRLFGLVRKDDYTAVENLMNISYEEDLALSKLAAALGDETDPV